jgi:hypothetical protein
MADALEASLATEAGMVGATALADAAGGPPGSASGPIAPNLAAAATAATPSAPPRPTPVISGTARPNPARVPYPPEAYAGDDEDEVLTTTARRRAAARSASERRVRRDEGIDDDRGGTSPLVWLTGIIAIALLAAVAFFVFQLASGNNPGPDGSPELVTVPNFVGKQIATATAEAEDLGLTLAPTTVESTQPAGTILTQDQAVGAQIESGGSVNVTVAAAPGTVQVPDLKNRTEVEAVTILFAANLRPGLKTDAFDPIVPEGLIVSQVPLFGEAVPPQTQVNYVISMGPEPTPSPSPSPTPTPTPEPTPTPTPEPTPEPTPPPTPEPTPTAEPTPPPEPPVEPPIESAPPG